MTVPPRQPIDELLLRHLPGVRAFVRRQMGPKLRSMEESRDLTQSVAREALQHADRFRSGSESGFSDWLLTTARRKVLHRAEYWHAQKRQVDQVAGAEGSVTAQPAPGRGPAEAAAASDLWRVIDAAFAALTPDQREVVLSHQIGGQSHVEIAARLGKSPEAVRSIHARAMARLATLLGGVAGERS